MLKLCFCGKLFETRWASKTCSPLSCREPLDLEPEEIRQAFAADHIRSVQEQAAWLSRRTPPKLTKIPGAVGPMKLDPERGGVIVHRTFISKEDMRRALRYLQ